MHVEVLRSHPPHSRVGMLLDSRYPDQARTGYLIFTARFAVSGSRFAGRGSRFAVRGSRFAVRGSRFAVRGERLTGKLAGASWKLIMTPRACPSSDRGLGG